MPAPGGLPNGWTVLSLGCRASGISAENHVFWTEAGKREIQRRPAGVRFINCARSAWECATRVGCAELVRLNPDIIVNGCLWLLEDSSNTSLTNRERLDAANRSSGKLGEVSDCARKECGVEEAHRGTTKKKREVLRHVPRHVPRHHLPVPFRFLGSSATGTGERGCRSTSSRYRLSSGTCLAFFTLVIFPPTSRRIQARSSARGPASISTYFVMRRSIDDSGRRASRAACTTPSAITCRALRALSATRPQCRGTGWCFRASVSALVLNYRESASGTR